MITSGTWKLMSVKGGWACLTVLWGYIRQKKADDHYSKTHRSVKLSPSNKCENHPAASYLAPKVGKRLRGGTRGVSGRWMDVAREEHRRLPKCLLARSGFSERVCVRVHDWWTPKPHCHMLFPAKHLAAVQDNWLVSAEVITALINSSQQGLTPEALHPPLVYFHGSPRCGTSLTTARTNVMCFQSGRESALIFHLETTIAGWNSNLPCKVPFRGSYYQTGFHL